MNRTTAALATAVLASVALAACGSSDQGSSNQGSSSAASGSPSSGQGGRLTVFAAASLKDTFTQLGKQFESTHPGTEVDFDFGGSSGLVTQLQEGAPADVFASADQKNMDKAVQAGLVSGTPTPFAKNTLTIVTAPGNPKKVTSLQSLTAPGTSVVVCAAPVPCGAATVKVEKASGVTLKPVSEEQSVTDVLGKVTSGQADAGLVYVTDAKSAGAKVTAVPFPQSSAAVNTYPIATLSKAANPALAKEFVSLVTGTQGREVLAAAGFAAP